jgi:hypothetical protein
LRSVIAVRGALALVLAHPEYVLQVDRHRDEQQPRQGSPARAAAAPVTAVKNPAQAAGS